MKIVNLITYGIFFSSKCKLPTNQELAELNNNQSYKLPIIIAIISENLSVNFFVYTL